jgi:uncharacterized protein YjiS (DUF1127 family)
MKSTFSYQPYPSAARMGGRQSLSSRLANFIRRVVETHRLRKTLRELPDSVLRDIGISRDEIEDAGNLRLNPRDFPGGGYQ